MIYQVFGLILFLTGTLSLNPSGQYCRSNLDCTDGFECPPASPWKPPFRSGQERFTYYPRCRPRLAPEGVFCSPKCKKIKNPFGGWSDQRCVCGAIRRRGGVLKHRDRELPHVGVCANLDPTVPYCIQDNHCVDGYKCAASGQENLGICKPDSDPTGEYCLSSKDCKWYLFETCSDQGECSRPWKPPVP